jgi:hypothetical protein
MYSKRCTQNAVGDDDDGGIVDRIIEGFCCRKM